MNVFEMHPEIVVDALELGMRVAVALFVENETNEENFIRILNFKHGFRA